jgi:PAS domain S-box-containing protein
VLLHTGSGRREEKERKLRSPLERNLSVIFGCGLAGIVVLGAMQFRMMGRLKSDHQWVAHTQEVQRELEATQESLNRADATAQSYLLTGEPSYRTQYDRATRNIQEHLQNLEALISKDSQQQSRLRALQPRLNDSVRAFQAELDARKPAPTPAEGISLLENNVRRANALSRSLIGEMQAEESRLLTERSEAADKSNQQSNSLILVGSLLAFVLLGAAGLALHFDIGRRQQAEETLRQNEERFRLLVSGVRDYAICFLDPKGRIGSWNMGAERITGYKAWEVLGQNFSCLFAPEDQSAGLPQHLLEHAVKDGRVEEKGWRVRKDGTRYWTEAALSALKDDRGQLQGFAKITRDVTESRKAQEAIQSANQELEREVQERRRADAKLRASERSLRQLSAHLLRTQEEERRRIGRELHDSLGQHLAMVKMCLAGLQTTLGAEQGEIAEQFTECSDSVDGAIKEVRTISYLLYPPMLEELGLESAVPWYLDGFSKRSGIETSLEVTRAFGRLPAAVELALFRVLQESLTNVHRHSGSATARVRLARENGQVIFEVQDSGKGLPHAESQAALQESPATPGVGLRGMSERLREVGGTLEINSGQQGTTVRAIVPFSDKADAVRTS